MPRASSTPYYAQCPGFAVLRGAGPKRPVGAAAHTGSATGRGIELWHRLGEDALALAEALRQVRHEASDEFPLYDEEQTAAWVGAYAGDPRNRGTVVADWQEREVRLSLPPAPEDPTGRPVVLVGHVDQVRRTPHGGLRVWDVKTSKGNGRQLTAEFAWQLAAYALGASETWGEGDVLPGGIIRVRGYATRKSHPPGQEPAFWATEWTHEQCRELLATLVHHVSLIRQGIILCNPGTQCAWCPGVSPAHCAEHIAQIPDDLFIKFADGEEQARDESDPSGN